MKGVQSPGTLQGDDAKCPQWMIDDDGLSGRMVARSSEVT